MPGRGPAPVMNSPAADSLVADSAANSGSANESAKTAAATPPEGSEGGAGAAGTDYSWTNLQVQGVDEADIVKTDGKYIYKVNSRRIDIAEAYPAAGMKIAGTLDFNDRPASDFTPIEMYVDTDRLVVIGNESRANAAVSAGKGPGGAPAEKYRI